MKRIIIMMMLMCSTIFAKGWETLEVKDDFGDKTGEVYIAKYFTKGSFSNSATSDSKLEGAILVRSDAIEFATFEYGIERGVESDMNDITIKMRNSEGETLTIEAVGVVVAESSSYTENAVEKIKDFFKKSSGDIRVVIKDKYSTVQKFVINANGFTKALKSIKG